MKSVFTWFKINSMKKIPEKFEFMFLSKTWRPKYNLLIDLNVIKSLLKAELLGFIIKNNNVSWKTYCKIMPNSFTQTPENPRVLGIVLGIAFVDSQFNLYAYNSDVLQENCFTLISRNSP